MFLARATILAGNAHAQLIIHASTVSIWLIYYWKLLLTLAWFACCIKFHCTNN